VSIRAWGRYRAPRKYAFLRRRKRNAAPPNLIVIGGLKCGTTSLHHYLGLHPEIQMSKPKELSFFISELNWRLGLDWYESRFDRRYPVRGESSPHYTNLPRFTGVAARLHECCPDARLIYMVRDPIQRLLSHWLQTCGSGYETREIGAALSNPESPYILRSQYWMQLQPFLRLFDGSQIEILTQEEMRSERNETMRKAFRFAGVDECFSSDEFSREWERTSAKSGRKYRFLNTTIRFPGLRAFDERYDRLPESLRWSVERILHEPGKPSQPKPELSPDLIEMLRDRFAGDVTALQEFAGREFAGWRSY
jgi:hypothetical protein